MTKTILDKIYDDESSIDIEQDIAWAIDEIPIDENGNREGSYHLTLTWTTDDQ